jgi:hypothetical protein
LFRAKREARSEEERKLTRSLTQIMEASGHRCESSVRRYNHSSDNQRLAIAQLAVQTGKEQLHEVQQRIVLSQVNVNLPVQQPQQEQQQQRKKARSNAAFPFEGLFQGANMTGATINFNFGGNSPFASCFPSSGNSTVRPTGVREAEYEEEEEEDEPLVRFR